MASELTKLSEKVEDLRIRLEKTNVKATRAITEEELNSRQRSGQAGMFAKIDRLGMVTKKGDYGYYMDRAYVGYKLDNEKVEGKSGHSGLPVYTGIYSSVGLLVEYSGTAGNSNLPDTISMTNNDLGRLYLDTQANILYQLSEGEGLYWAEHEENEGEYFFDVNGILYHFDGSSWIQMIGMDAGTFIFTNDFRTVYGVSSNDIITHISEPQFANGQRFLITNKNSIYERIMAFEDMDESFDYISVRITGSGNTLPGSATEGDYFLKIDSNELYRYVDSDWITVPLPNFATHVANSDFTEIYSFNGTVYSAHSGLTNGEKMYILQEKKVFRATYDSDLSRFVWSDIVSSNYNTVRVVSSGTTSDMEPIHNVQDGTLFLDLETNKIMSHASGSWTEVETILRDTVIVVGDFEKFYAWVSGAYELSDVVYQLGDRLTLCNEKSIYSYNESYHYLSSEINDLVFSTEVSNLKKKTRHVVDFCEEKDFLYFIDADYAGPVVGGTGADGETGNSGEYVLNTTENTLYTWGDVGGTAQWVSVSDIPNETYFIKSGNSIALYRYFVGSWELVTPLNNSYISYELNFNANQYWQYTTLNGYTEQSLAISTGRRIYCHNKQKLYVYEIYWREAVANSDGYVENGKTLYTTNVNLHFLNEAPKYTEVDPSTMVGVIEVIGCGCDLPKEIAQIGDYYLHGDNLKMYDGKEWNTVDEYENEYIFNSDLTLVRKNYDGEWVKPTVDGEYEFPSEHLYLVTNKHKALQIERHEIDNCHSEIWFTSEDKTEDELRTGTFVKIYDNEQKLYQVKNCSTELFTHDFTTMIQALRVRYFGKSGDTDTLPDVCDERIYLNKETGKLMVLDNLQWVVNDEVEGEYYFDRYANVDNGELYKCVRGKWLKQTDLPDNLVIFDRGFDNRYQYDKDDDRWESEGYDSGVYYFENTDEYFEFGEGYYQILPGHENYPRVHQYICFENTEQMYRKKHVGLSKITSIINNGNNYECIEVIGTGDNINSVSPSYGDYYLDTDSTPVLKMFTKEDGWVTKTVRNGVLIVQNMLGGQSYSFDGSVYQQISIGNGRLIATNTGKIYLNQFDNDITEISHEILEDTFFLTENGGTMIRFISYEFPVVQNLILGSTFFNGENFYIKGTENGNYRWYDFEAKTSISEYIGSNHIGKMFLSVNEQKFYLYNDEYQVFEELTTLPEKFYFLNELNNRIHTTLTTTITDLTIDHYMGDTAMYNYSTDEDNHVGTWHYEDNHEWFVDLEKMLIFYSSDGQWFSRILEIGQALLIVNEHEDNGLYVIEDGKFKFINNEVIKLDQKLLDLRSEELYNCDNNMMDDSSVDGWDEVTSYGDIRYIIQNPTNTVYTRGEGWHKVTEFPLSTLALVRDAKKHRYYDLVSGSWTVRENKTFVDDERFLSTLGRLYEFDPHHQEEGSVYCEEFDFDSNENDLFIDLHGGKVFLHDGETFEEKTTDNDHLYLVIRNDSTDNMFYRLVNGSWESVSMEHTAFYDIRTNIRYSYIPEHVEDEENILDTYVENDIETGPVNGDVKADLEQDLVYVYGNGWRKVIYHEGHLIHDINSPTKFYKYNPNQDSKWQEVQINTQVEGAYFFDILTCKLFKVREKTVSGMIYQQINSLNIHDNTAFFSINRPALYWFFGGTWYAMNPLLPQSNIVNHY